MIRSLPAERSSLSLAEARNLALAAQGFSGRRTTTPSPWRRLASVVDRIGLLQLDSVNVLIRAHYAPLFSRIGAYDRTAFDRRAFASRHRSLFEYWAHEASLLPLHLHPLLRWRMARAQRLVGIYSGLAKFVREDRAFVKSIMREVAERGPVAAGDLAGEEKRTASWWGWNRTKGALEYLFWTGAVTVAERRGFERIYDLTERVLPYEILSLATPNPADAIRDLVRLAGRALGVAIESDIRDYFRLPVAETRQAIAELVEEGTLLPVSVDGWRQPAFLYERCEHRTIRPTALISPFDPLIWCRSRSQRLFGLHYRLEIYVPAAQRRHGYYVLPFLHGGRFRARVDLKADRVAGVLQVRAAHLEPGHKAGPTAAALADELRRMTRWLELREVRVADKGDLAAALADHFRDSRTL